MTAVSSSRKQLEVDKPNSSEPKKKRNKSSGDIEGLVTATANLAITRTSRIQELPPEIILNEIFPHLNVADAISLGQSCRAFRVLLSDAIENHMKRVKKIFLQTIFPAIDREFSEKAAFVRVGFFDHFSETTLSQIVRKGTVAEQEKAFDSWLHTLLAKFHEGSLEEIKIQLSSFFLNHIFYGSGLPPRTFDCFFNVEGRVGQHQVFALLKHCIAEHDLVFLDHLESIAQEFDLKEEDKVLFTVARFKIYLKLKKLKEASEILKAIPDAYHERKRLLCSLGETYIAQHQIDEAFSVAAELTGDFQQRFIFESITFFCQRMLKNNELDRVLQIAHRLPGDIAIYFLIKDLIRAYVKNNNINEKDGEKLIGCLLSTYQIGGSKIVCFKIFLKLDKLEHAQDLLKQIARSHPERKSFLYDLGQAYVSRGQVDEAFSLISELYSDDREGLYSDEVYDFCRYVLDGNNLDGLLQIIKKLPCDSRLELLISDLIAAYVERGDLGKAISFINGLSDLNFKKQAREYLFLKLMAYFETTSLEKVLSLIKTAPTSELRNILIYEAALLYIKRGDFIAVRHRIFPKFTEGPHKKVVSDLLSIKTGGWLRCL